MSPNEQQIVIVIAIITNDKGEILLAKRYEPELPHIHGKWEFIGGGINIGEDLEDAVRREAKEEAGIEVKIVRLLPQIFTNLWTLPNGQKRHVVMASYECKIVSGEPTPNKTENVGDLKFVNIDDIKHLDTLPKVYEMAKMTQSIH